MSRIIKFRAWNKEDNKMYYNAQNTYDWQNDGCPDTHFGEILNNNDYVAMQYTGLDDVNDTEVYEGDYILISNKTKVEVVFKNCAFRFRDINSIISEYDIYKYTDKLNYKVIGNIFEGIRTGK